MSLPSFGSGTSVNFEAAWINAVLIESLYQRDRSIAEQYAEVTGSTLKAWVVDPSTFPPDYCVFKNGNDYLIVLAGTTNKPQWAWHIASAYLPLYDQTFGNSVVGSFKVGEAAVEQSIFNEIFDIPPSTIRITGHSYGAAAGFILGVHLQFYAHPPTEIQLMTFGEPKSYGRKLSYNEFFHCRIVNEKDPVPYAPPAAAMMFGLGSVLNTVLLVEGVRFIHFGTKFYMDESAPVILPVTHVPDVTFSDVIALGLFAPDVLSTHPLVPGYLKVMQMHLPTQLINGPLGFLFVAYNKWALPGVQVTVTTPQDPNVAQLNGGWFPGQTPGPVTVEGLPSAAIVSSLVEVKSFNSGGNGMVALRAVIDYNIDNQGFSEAFESVPSGQLGSGKVAGPTDYTTMLAKVKQALLLRMQLSMSSDNTGCVNPVVPAFIKIADTQTLRSSLTTQVNFPTPGASKLVTAQLPATLQNQNAPGPICAKLTFQSGQARQKAQVFLHGLPHWFFWQSAQQKSILGNWGVVKRQSIPADEWNAALIAFSNFLYNNGLGFRYLTSPWDMPNPTPPPAMIVGSPGPNAFPVAIAYNQQYSQYEIQLQPGASGMNVFDRYVLRKWKNFKLLNGRFAGQLVTGTAPTWPSITNNVIRIQRRMVQQANVQLGTISLERFTPFCPGLTLTTPGSPAPGVQFYFVTEKKLGASLELERGRQRNRPT